MNVGRLRLASGRREQREQETKDLVSVYERESRVKNGVHSVREQADITRALIYVLYHV